MNKNMGIYIIIIILLMAVAAIILAAYFFTDGAPPEISKTIKEQIEKNNEIVNREGAERAEQDTNLNQEQSNGATVLMRTNFGDIKLKLFANDAPKTVENFIKLSESGFYNGVKFHRVIKGFMIQTGDPNSKDSDWADDGTGGPGYTFPDEINNRKIIRGTLAMANSGPNTNGSQFFILTAESAPWLDGKHTVFGEVAEGMDAVLKIENVNTDKSRGDHPAQDIIILSVEILK